MPVSRFWCAEFLFHVEYNVLFLRHWSNPKIKYSVCVTLKSCQAQLKTLNSLTAKSVLAGEKPALFGRYLLNFYVWIVHYILLEMKTWRAKIYLPTQRTNWRILTSANKMRFWPSTYVIDAASFVKIASNSRQAEVIACSTHIKLCERMKIWQEPTVLQS